MSASASAWHGCSSAVSALITGTDAHSAHASSSSCACVRTASASTYRESARAVSGSDSPREICSSSGLSAIAVPPRCAIATENDTRVRVECFEK